MSASPIPVGVRLPLATENLPPAELLRVCRTAVDLGYSSVWVGEHVLLPDVSNSHYPHVEGGVRPFAADTPWLDPLLQLTWLAAQLPDVRLGTSVMILTLRNPRLLAKQLSSVSWLTERPFSFGVGSGWLRQEYDAVGVPFEKRATRAREQISEIKQLLADGRRDYQVRDPSNETVAETFIMEPKAPSTVDFLWGGFSPAALRLVATSCDGWLPAKQPLAELRKHLDHLRRACDDVGRNIEDLRLVVKPGSGPDPESGRIDAANLDWYASNGFSEAVLEMPYGPDGHADAARILEHVAKRSWS